VKLGGQVAFPATKKLGRKKNAMITSLKKKKSRFGKVTQKRKMTTTHRGPGRKGRFETGNRGYIVEAI